MTITEAEAEALRYMRDALAERLDVRTQERDEARAQYEASDRRVAQLVAGMDRTTEGLRNAGLRLMAAEAEIVRLRAALGDPA